MFPRSLFIRLTALLLLVGCGKGDNNCPGLCPSENVPPTMTISTADGEASIASAKVRNSPCTVMLTHSAGEVGVPTGYATVQVTYNGPRDNPPLCIVELTSLWGEVEVLAPQAKSRLYQQTCCPYGTCCAKESVVTQQYHLAFDPATQTVSFAPAPDGGVGNDANTQTPDAVPPLDVLDQDASGIDAESVDVADEFDLAIDA